MIRAQEARWFWGRPAPVLPNGLTPARLTPRAGAHALPIISFNPAESGMAGRQALPAPGVWRARVGTR